MFHNKKWQLTSLALAISTMLGGCLSGSSDSESTDTELSTTVRLSGIVADGYLENALVCLDVNLNKLCDSSEPQVYTDSNGAYGFDTVKSDADKSPVIAVITAATKDADDPGRTLQPYILSAPVGKPGFISPMTTMIQTQLESNPGMTVANAEAVLKSSLGYGAESTVSLFEDYVAAKADTSRTDKADYERIHRVAQVTARVLENNYSQIQTAATGAGLDASTVLNELIRIEVNEIINQLDAISNEIDSSTGTFDAGAITTAVNVAVDTTSIADTVASEQNTSTAAVSNMQTILSGGFNNLQSDYIDANTVMYGYHNAILNSAGTAFSESSYFYNSTSKTWELDSESNNNGGDIQLTSTGWEASTGDVSISFSGDQTVVTEGASNFSVTGSTVDISDKEMRLLLNNNQWLSAVPGNAVFSTGANSYRFTFTQNNDVYTINNWDGCENPSLTNGNCNFAESSPYNRATPYSIPATTLTSIISAMVWTDDGNSSPIAPFIGYNEVDKTSLNVEFVGSGSSGITNFYRYDYINRNTATNYHGISKVGSGTWALETVSGQSLLTYDVPAALHSVIDQRQADSFFFAVQDGFVRPGAMTAKGSVGSDKDFTMNSVVINDLKTCFKGGAGDCTVRWKKQDGDGTLGAISTFKMQPFTKSDVINTSMKITFTTTDGEESHIIKFGSTAMNGGHYGFMGTISSLENSATVVENIEWKKVESGKLKIWLPDGSVMLLTKTNSTVDDGLVHFKYEPSANSTDAILSLMATFEAAPVDTAVTTTSSIVGAWRTTGTDGSFAFMSLFADNTFVYVENDKTVISASENGTEAGTYIYDSTTNIITFTLSYDDNLSSGGSSGVGSVGTPALIDAVLSNVDKTLTLADGALILSAVDASSSPMLGIWYAVNGVEFSMLALFDDNTFYYAENDLTVENPSLENGLEAGTYSYDSTSNNITFTLSYDDNLADGASSGIGSIGSPAVIEAVLSDSDKTLILASGALKLNRGF